ncbi:MAG: sigma factor-like helix-turn-helix DNA-binding protein [Candidatus Korobacteraceae bacterium]
MNVHVAYKLAKNSAMEKEINQQVAKLEKRLQVFRPDLLHLRVVLEQNSAREGFVLALNLKLPSADLAASEHGPTHTVVVKAAFDDLLEQVAKHKSQLRNEYKWRGRRAPGGDRSLAEVPFEQTLAAVHPPKVSDTDIRTYVNVNLGRLARFVQREIRYRETLGELRPGQLSVEEVIDETIVEALGDSLEKPELLALEPWLYRISTRAMESLAGRGEDEVSTVSLDQAGERPSHHISSEMHLAYHEPDDELINREVISDPRIATPEARAASAEMIDMIEAALQSASREDREAFLLFTIEGFTLEEIGAISDRPIADVRNSVMRAREHLQKNLPVTDPLKDKLLEYSKIA